MFSTSFVMTNNEVCINSLMSFTCVKLLVVQFSKINLANNSRRQQLLYHIMSGSECQAFFQKFYLTSCSSLVIQCVAYWLTSWPELEYTMLIKFMQVLFSKKV